MDTSPAGSSASASTAPQLGAFDDTMSDLYGLLTELGAHVTENGETEVQEDQNEEHQAEEQQQQALQQAQANQANSGDGFFASLGHFFSDACSDIANGRFGSLFDDMGRDASAMWNSPAFWSDLEHGLEDVAIVAGAVATTVVTLGSGSGVATIGAVAAITAASAGAAAGCSEARVKTFAADAKDDEADAASAGAQIHQLQNVTDEVVDDVKDREKGTQQEAKTIGQAIQTNDETTVAPAATVVRG